jgi:hypothetical protein
MLKQLNSHARDNNITFEEEGHKYTINGETNYTSVTTWLKKFFYPFNDELIITNMMKSPKWPDSKYFGMTKDEIKKQWRDNGNEAAKLGTAMHKMFEDHYNGLYVDGSNTGVEYDYFTNFINDHPTLKPFRSEWTVYDEDLRLSGSIDMLFINEDGTLSIYDWKRCKSMDKTVSFNKYAKPPIKHIPDTNFWHYSIQLNAYKMIIERKYGYKIKDMFLVCIHPELDTNYQKHEVAPMYLSVLFNQEE